MQLQTYAGVHLFEKASKEQFIKSHKRHFENLAYNIFIHYLFSSLQRKQMAMWIILMYANCINSNNETAWLNLVPMQQHHRHHLPWMDRFKRWHHDILIIIKKKMGPWIMAPWYILIIIIKSSNPTSNSNNEIVWLNLVVEGGRWLNFDQYTMCIIQCFTILTV